MGLLHAITRFERRCDRCGAEARVLVLLIAGELLFCGHHFGLHELRLRELALEVDDHRIAYAVPTPSVLPS